MSTIAQYAAALAGGIELLRDVHHAGLTRTELAAALSIGASEAGALIKISRELLRPIDDPHESTRRTQAIAIMDATATPITKIRVIAAAVHNLNSGAAVTRETLRLELTRIAHKHDVDRLKSLAIDRVREANASTAPNHSRRGLFMARNPDASGMRRAHIVLPDAQMRALHTRLHATAQRLRRTDATLTHAQALADALASAVIGGSERPLGVTIVMTTDDLRSESVTAVDKRGREPLFELSDGARITGAELITREIDPHPSILIYHDGEPVDLYRTRRTANHKQRQIIALDQRMCAHPACDRPAVTCQAHHILAWALGGDTNQGNLAGLCSEHNRWNDDHPSRTHIHGRVVRDPETRRIAWQPPQPGAKPRINQHPACSRSAGAWAATKRAANTDAGSGPTHSA